MGPYTNPLRNQMAVLDECIRVDNSLAVPVQLRLAIMKWMDTMARKIS